MYFLKGNARTSNLFNHLNALKLPDKVTLENPILMFNYLYIHI